MTHCPVLADGMLFVPHLSNMSNQQKHKNMNMLKFSPGRRMFPSSFFGALPAYYEDVFSGKDFASFVPSVNISENDKAWSLEVSAPGFSKEDFKINLDKEVLTVSAEHKAEANKDEKNYTRREFAYGSFSRTFRIKENTVDMEKIGATYENGILNVVLPKKEVAPEKAVKEIRIS
jgi:HSP20 family protein